MTKPNIHAVHRDWDRDFPVIVRTEGIYLFDEHGRRYIDGSGGSSVVTSLGHGVAEIPQAMYDQAQKFSFYPAHAFTNQPFLDLCDLIVSLAPGELRDNSRVWITCTGTDATDDAVRLARQYWVESGQPSKYQIISRWQAFHGNNVAVAGFSGLTARRKIFQPMYIDSPHIPPAFCYRCAYEQTYPACNLLCARALETAILQQGPENVAAFIAEPVVGAALGCVPAPDGYFQKIREICDRHNVLFIADEVMTGWGRTGKMWGIEHWNVTPDIIATAKGMTAGYTPLSAILAGRHLAGARTEPFRLQGRPHAERQRGIVRRGDRRDQLLAEPRPGGQCSDARRASAGRDNRPDGEASDHRRCARPGADVWLRAGGRSRYPVPLPARASR